MDAAKRIFLADGLACQRGARILFRNISFALEAGGILHVTGPNGCGKTSLLRQIAGSLPITEGTVTWQGEKDVMYLPPHDALLKRQDTAAETLLFWARVLGADKSAMRDALEKTGFCKRADMPVRHMSAGQKRRLSLARVFLKPQAIWLLDEPKNALDDGARAMLHAELSAHCARGGAAVIAGHDAIEQPDGARLQTLALGQGAA